MIAEFPDNDINAELKSRLDNLDVNGNEYKFYVKRVTSQKQKFYFLKSTKLNSPFETKCGTGHITPTQIQATVIQPKNVGSELILNNAIAALFNLLEDFSLPSSTGLVVNRHVLSVINDLEEDIGGDTVYRKIVLMETTIN